MRIRARILLLLVLTTLATGCRQHSFYSFDLKKESTKVFALDEFTTPISHSTKYFSDTSGEYYIHLNKNTNTVYYYNFTTSHLLGKIDFSQKFPQPYNMYFLNFDSIFFFYYLPKNFILIADSARNELFRRNSGATIEFEKQLSMIDANNIRPILIEGKNLFYSTLILTEYQKMQNFDCALGGSINLNDLSRNNFIFYPAIYSKHNWGLMYHRMQSHCFDDDYMILSFPASEYLYRYSLNGNSYDSILAKSSLIDNVKPYRRKRIAKFDKEKSIRFYLLNTTYSAIYYDNYNSLYYRFVEVKIKKKEINFNNLQKNISVIILNENMEKIGESFLGKGYFPANCLITPQGLFIRFFDSNEDNVVYHNFKLKKK